MKRGSSGLSLLIAVNKPQGMTSHDVVNRCRRIFGERRVGHAGTLDPLASGVLPLAVGPATRLDKYLTGHDKTYRAGIAFGAETATDDAEGEVTRTADVPSHLFDEDYAASFAKSLVGEHKQLPPAYSAVKVGGVKAYEAARKGAELELEYRTVRILDAQFTGMQAQDDSGYLVWGIEVCVSKGTYIRSLARDIGRIVGSAAHVSSLERIRSGCIGIDQAVSLETLEALGTQAAIDPVAALGLRFSFADDYRKYVESGNVLYERQVILNELLPERQRNGCACMGATRPSCEGPRSGELIAIVVENKLKAIYAYDAEKRIWKPDCVFQVPILRG